MIAGIAAARGVAIVPTLVNIDNFPEFAEAGAGEVPALRRPHARAARRAATTRSRRACEAGVPVYAGTDAGGSVAHGRLAGEVAELAAPGCRRPPRWTPPAGAPGRGSAGRGLEEGAPADLVVYDRDPRADLGVLAHPDPGRAARPRRRLRGGQLFGAIR